MSNNDPKEYSRQWYLKNKKKKALKYKEDSKVNPNKYKERSKKYYEKNKAKKLLRNLEYKKTDKFRKYHREYNKRPENRRKESIRSNSRYNFKKTNICSRCGRYGTQLHHLSYEPSIIIELCEGCHLKEHNKELVTK